MNLKPAIIFCPH